MSAATSVLFFSPNTGFASVAAKYRDLVGIASKSGAVVLQGVQYDEIHVFAFQLGLRVGSFVVGFERESGHRGAFL